MFGNELFAGEQFADEQLEAAGSSFAVVL